MKITIKILYNGKEYRSLDDATIDAVINTMKETMEEDIEPFGDEILQQGGEVILNIKGDTLGNISGELQVNSISKDLKARILAAVGK